MFGKHCKKFKTQASKSKKMFDILRTKIENIERDVTLIKKFAKKYKQNLSSLARFSSVVVHEIKKTD